MGLGRVGLAAGTRAIEPDGKQVIAELGFQAPEQTLDHPTLGLVERGSGEGVVELRCHTGKDRPTRADGRRRRSAGGDGLEIQREGDREGFLGVGVVDLDLEVLAPGLAR